MASIPSVLPTTASSYLPAPTMGNVVIGLGVLAIGYLLTRTDVCGKSLRGRVSDQPPYTIAQAQAIILENQRARGILPQNVAPAAEAFPALAGISFEQNRAEWNAYQSLIQFVERGQAMEESCDLLAALTPAQFFQPNLHVCLRVNLLTSLIRRHHVRARDVGAQFHQYFRDLPDDLYQPLWRTSTSSHNITRNTTELLEVTAEDLDQAIPALIRAIIETSQ